MSLLLQDTMRAAVLHGAEDLRIEDIPIPIPGPGEFVMKVEAALTCGTDLKVFRRGYHAKMLKPPCVFGHEMAGTVTMTGEQAPVAVGDHVVVANSAPCGRCYFCNRKQENLCEDLHFLNGAYAEYILVPARFAAVNTLQMPSHLSFEEAAISEPLACVIHGLNETPVRAGNNVGVIGLGPIGLLFTSMLKARNCTVYCAGRQPARLEAARRLGAASVIDVPQHTPLYAACAAWPKLDMVVEATGRPEIWEQAIDLVRRGGTVNWFGGPPADTKVTLQTNRIHYDQITLKSPFHHRPPCVKEALETIARGTVKPLLFLGGETGLEELPALFKSMLGGAPFVKTIVRPGVRGTKPA